MKILKVAGVISILLVALAVMGVTLVFSQWSMPVVSPWWNAMNNMMQGYGGDWGAMGEMHNWMSRDGDASNMYEWMRQSGGLGWMQRSGGVHEAVWKALSDRLGVTPDQLYAEIDGGKTLTQVAEEQGLSAKDLAATLQSAMETALDQAVEEEALTQEQAGWMLDHMKGQYEWMLTHMGAGYRSPGPGGCHDDDWQDDRPSSF